MATQFSLFGTHDLPELQGETYYACLDSIEQVDLKVNLRFDCINTKTANLGFVNKESILTFPSIIIEVEGDLNSIRARLKYYNLYLLESYWMLITTKLQSTELYLEQHFNFSRIDDEQQIGRYDLDSVLLYRDMDDQQKAKVKEITNATEISESSETDTVNFLLNQNHHSFSHVNVYNVGQGNCTALVDQDNTPLTYFDVGNGCNRNKHTYNANFKVCHREYAPIILSHWDQDHYHSALFDTQFYNHKWLAPKQIMTNTAYRLAQHLISKGNLVIWNNSLPYVDFYGHRIVKCSGNMNNKNNSGLAFFAHYSNNNYVLLPGDATFNKIHNYPSTQLIGLVASHHGARGAIRGMPPALTPNMLVYSYGLNNKEKHAHSTARRSYQKNGWGHGLDTVNGNIAIKQSPTSLTTPCAVRCNLQIGGGLHF